MAKDQIGFRWPRSESIIETWKLVLPEGTVIYTKTRHKDINIYDCECQRSISCAETSIKTSVQTPDDLSREEVERLPRFLDLLAGKI
jgi:hypothetical protein